MNHRQTTEIQNFIDTEIQKSIEKGIDEQSKAVTALSKLLKEKQQHTKKFADFPVGTFFSHRVSKSEPIVYGWIVGAGISPTGKLAFQVEWSHRNGRQMLHPALVKHVDDDWEDEEK